MEKLFELLQIYIIERQWREQFKLHWDKIILWRPHKLHKFPQYDTNAVIISKRFWFIEWLVENDKIDTDELLDIYWETSQSMWQDNKYELYSEYERLLMLLALQDEPIEFLCNKLK